MIDNTLVLQPKDLVGDSEGKFQKVKNVFRAAKSAAGSAELRIILIEDIDFICGSSQKTGGNQELMYTFLGELDALESNEKVLIIATTSQLDKLEKSVRRGGRLDLDIRLDMPNDNDRYLIFKEHLGTIPNSIKDENLRMIARASSGFVSSDLAQIIRNCHMRAIKNHKPEVSQQDLEA